MGCGPTRQIKEGRKGETPEVTVKASGMQQLEMMKDEKSGLKSTNRERKANSNVREGESRKDSEKLKEKEYEC